jgi:hypothetical protein
LPAKLETNRTLAAAVRHRLLPPLAVIEAWEKLEEVAREPLDTLNFFKNYVLVPKNLYLDPYN